MQRDRDDVLVADAASELIRDEDVPLSPTRMLTSVQVGIKIHRSDFLSLCHVRIWANGMSVYAFWRNAKVMMCDGGYVYDAHNTGGLVLGSCNQSREQQLGEVKVTYGRAVWLIRHHGLYGKGIPRTKNIRSELSTISLCGQPLHWWKYESAVKRGV